MSGLQETMKRMGDTFNLVGALIVGYPVIESPCVKPGDILVEKDPRRILVYKPTEIERMVRLRFREAHPWFKDPLDPMRLIR